MGKLTTRDSVIEVIEGFDLAQKLFHQANAQLQAARNASSATATLQGRVEHEAASARLLQSAAELETVLVDYRQQTDDDYRKSIEAATVDSRRLHSQRLELEAEMANLQREIAAVEERERPAVEQAVQGQQTASTFAQMWEAQVSDCVKLATQQAAA